MLIGNQGGLYWTFCFYFYLFWIYSSPWSLPQNYITLFLLPSGILLVSTNRRLYQEKVKSLSRVWLFATPWTVAYQAPLSMGFSRQEYWSELPLPSPGESSWPRDQTQVSCIAGRCFNLWATREPGKKKTKLSGTAFCHTSIPSLPTHHFDSDCSPMCVHYYWAGHLPSLIYH